MVGQISVKMRLFLLLNCYCLLGYAAPARIVSGLEDHTAPQSDAPINSENNEISTNHRSIRSTQLSANETIYLIIQSLKNISSENDQMQQRQKVLNLGSNIANNKSLTISSTLTSYVYSIISNITYKDDMNLTNSMIANLQTMFEEEVEASAFNYTAFRMTDTDEQRLLRSLMTNYEKAVRPVLRASDPIILKIGLTMNQIDVVEKNQVLSTLVWLDQEWIDEKLVWNPKDYNGLEVLRIPCTLLWLPDVVLYNSVEDMKGGYMQSLAMVSHTGNVFWPPIVKFNGACEIKIKYFPFDDQQCKLKLGTWSYDGNQVNLTKRRQGIDLENYQENGEWRLTDTKVARNEVRYACCDVPYIDVTFHVFMQRRTLYYTYNIIIPCVMLSILTLLCFWMKPDSGEKISLGLTILLAFSVFMLLIAENMPSTSVDVPIIGIYITSSMCITAFSVIVGVFVANVNNQADGDRQVPYWVHKICYALSKVTCLKMTSYEERHFNIKMLAMNSQVVIPSGVLRKRGNSQRRKKSIANRTEELRNEVRNGSINLAEAHLAHVESKKLNEREVQTEAGSGSVEADPLLQRLHSIVQHQEELLQKQCITEDWHLVAIVIDRCLFWIYLLMMLSTTIGCLVIFPLTKAKVELGDDVIPA